SLDRSDPAASIVRKLYALLAQCQRRLGQQDAVRETLRRGRALFPEDAELLFQEGVASREAGEGARAEACWQELLGLPPPGHVGSVHAGLRGYLTRHNLAGLCWDQQRFGEAEAQWRAAVAERPDFVPALVGLGELLLGQARYGELEPVVRHLAGAGEEGLVEA